jgi:hypothetical protein
MSVWIESWMQMRSVRVVALIACAGASIAASVSRITSAQPIGNPGAWATDLDYPPSARAAGVVGATGFDLLIDAVGRPVRCDVRQPSGTSILDAITCALMMKRARFKPARDQLGHPIASVWHSRVLWALPGRSFVPAPEPAELVLTVSKAPQKILGRTWYVIVVLGSDGKVEACDPSQKDRSETLSGTVCDAVRNQALPTTLGSDGQAIKTIRSVSVRFLLK